MWCWWDEWPSAVELGWQVLAGPDGPQEGPGSPGVTSQVLLGVSGWGCWVESAEAVCPSLPVVCLLYSHSISFFPSSPLRGKDFPLDYFQARKISLSFRSFSF